MNVKTLYGQIPLEKIGICLDLFWYPLRFSGNPSDLVFLS